MGTAERDIAKQIVRTGGTLPQRIQNAPTLRKGLELYFNAFFELDSERQNGMSIGRIPFTSMLRYASFYGFDFEQTELLLFYVQQMDNAHIQRLTEKNKK
jgi:hypothetical protein